MRVLPVTCTCCPTKTSNKKSVVNFKQQNPMTTMPKNQIFKRGGVEAATLIGAILGGTALILTVPAAVIAGAAAVGLWAGLQTPEADKNNK